MAKKLDHKCRWHNNLTSFFMIQSFILELRKSRLSVRVYFVLALGEQVRQWVGRVYSVLPQGLLGFGT